MDSLNPHVNALHTAFCEVSGQQLPMLPFFERNWCEAHNFGVTPEDITRVFKERTKGVQLGERRRASLLLRAFCGSEEAIASVVEESAALKARARMRVVDPARAAILRQTGREDKAPETPARAVGDTDLLNQLRKAAQ